MVVLAAAVCSKAGKAIFSRQFVAMPRVRVEGLVAAFPKLIGADTQHTFVETDAVRYVYQPVEQLYMILVTTKGSNIIEDLETLRLFVKLIPEYCQGHTEDHVKRHAFDLVMAMDEVVNLGYKEQVTVPQIKTFTDMDSHEEKLQKIIYESKISEARAAAQKKAESIDKQKAEMRKAQMESRGGGGGRYGSSGIGSDYSPMAPAASSPAMSSREQQEDELSLGPSKIKAGGFGSFASEKKEAKPAGKPARGMQLGKARPQDELVASIFKEEKLVTPVGGPMGMSGLSAAAPAQEAPKDKVFVKIEEKVVIHLERDGAIKKFEIKGEIKVVVQDPDQSRIFLRMNQTFRKEDGFVARLHPKIDKTAWEKNGVLALKDQGPNSRFPVGVDNAAVILKWRKVTSDDSELPFSVNFWPNDEDGKTVVNAEISHVKQGLSFQHVYLTVPFKQAQPQINSADGDVKYTRQDGLMWRIDEISENNPSATLEFAVPEVPADSLFPLHLNFYAVSTYANLAVEEILLVDGQAPVEFNQDVSLSSEEFLVE